MANVPVTAIENSLKSIISKLSSEYEVTLDSFKGGASSRYGYSCPSYVEVWVKYNGKFVGSTRFIANGYAANRGEISTDNGMKAAKVTFLNWLQRKTENL